MGGRVAQVGQGDTVAVFGCGPVGQFAILSASQQGSGGVIAVGVVRSRLEDACSRHAETVDFDAQRPVSGPDVPDADTAETFEAVATSRSNWATATTGGISRAW